MYTLTKVMAANFCPDFERVLTKKKKKPNFFLFSHLSEGFCNEVTFQSWINWCIHITNLIPTDLEQQPFLHWQKQDDDVRELELIFSEGQFKTGCFWTACSYVDWRYKHWNFGCQMKTSISNQDEGGGLWGKHLPKASLLLPFSQPFFQNEDLCTWQLACKRSCHAFHHLPITGI